MRGGEAGAFRTIIHPEYDFCGQCWVAAGPDAHDVLFNDVTADNIGEGCGQDKDQHPPPAHFAKIEGHKQEHEQVERHPKLRFAEERQYNIE